MLAASVAVVDALVSKGNLSSCRRYTHAPEPGALSAQWRVWLRPQARGNEKDESGGGL